MDETPFVYDEALARHYDEDYALLRADAGDVRFYRELARASPGPALEVGCGTGRVLLPIARAGVPVTGVDPSPAMLARLAARLADEALPVRERVTLAAGSATAPGVEGPFGLVCAPFRMLQHLETPAAQVAGLRALAARLGPGGRLAFDAFDFDPRVAARHVDEHLDYALERGGQRRERRSTATVDRARGVLHGEFAWLVDGAVVDRAAFRLALLDRRALEDRLQRAGLELLELWRDFEGTPWRADDPRELVVLARRRPADPDAARPPARQRGARRPG